MFRVFKTEYFEEKAQKFFDKNELGQIQKFIDKNLKPNGDKVADSLSYSYFREFKIGGKRIYYLVYKDLCLLLFVECSNKKTQQTTINRIKKLFPDFREQAQEIYENLKRKD